MDYMGKIIGDIELHSVEGIRECFDHGVDPNVIFNNEPLIYELTSEYTRSPRFNDCVKAFVDYGLKLSDPVLLAVLLNDASKLEQQLRANPNDTQKKYNLRCAYTQMNGVSLLHICAEFNHVACAEVLVKYGLDVDTRAHIDENGFGRQTPIFHTVNQNSNQSKDMLDFLLSHQADLHYTVAGIIWGKGYEWETLIPAVNPISYSIMGLLPQMHRDETTIFKTVSQLLQVAYSIHYESQNVPNAYLKG